MMIKFKNILYSVLLLTSSLVMSQNYPLSDPDNTGGWILNGDFSDEFEAGAINKTRWHLQGESCAGTPGCRSGAYFNNFKGRWPAQFTPDNAKVRDGKLIMETKWEPDFPFLDECDRNTTNPANIYCYGKDANGNSLPITTAGFNSLKQFTYGYMEIYSKAADAEITSAFWTIGSGSEIDMFEMFGKYDTRNATRKAKEKELKFNMIEWNTGFEPRFDTFIKTDFRVADDFHVYGFDWTDTSITAYIDGKFIRTFDKEDFNKGEGDEWFFTEAQRLWVDQEVFYWNGLPNQADLTAEFQIEYIRVWQKDADIEDTTKPVLSDLDISLANSGKVSVNVSEQAQLFLVPSTTAANADAIKTANENPLVSNEGIATVSNNQEAGEYVLYAMDWAGNISTASSTFTIAQDPTSLSSDFTNLISFSLYPNPSNSLVKIKSLKSVKSNEVTLYNALGQAFVLPLKNETFDVSTLNSGMYYVSIPGYVAIKFLKN